MIHSGMARTRLPLNAPKAAKSSGTKSPQQQRRVRKAPRLGLTTKASRTSTAALTNNLGTGTNLTRDPDTKQTQRLDERREALDNRTTSSKGMEPDSQMKDSFKKGIRDLRDGRKDMIKKRKLGEVRNLALRMTHL